MTPQQEAVNLIYGLSDDNAQFIVEVINRIKRPTKSEAKMPKRQGGIVLGLAKDKFYIDDQKFDAVDAEIAETFEGGIAYEVSFG